MIMPTTFAGVALKMAPGTASGYKGVTKHGAGWEARTDGRKRRCLGTYKDRVEAAYVLAMEEAKEKDQEQEDRVEAAYVLAMEEAKEKDQEQEDPQGISFNAAFPKGDSCSSHLSDALLAKLT